VFEPVLPVITPAQPHQAAVDQMFFACTPTQRIDMSHVQHNGIPINASNKASNKEGNIDIKPDQSLHHATTTPVNPKR
jgi:hypothetical protein|tara:strand:+ start:187 stop:420 length:234 start_codon:yes stop_codon:yes gene_type:complete